jgi:hypothetical protein
LRPDELRQCGVQGVGLVRFYRDFDDAGELSCQLGHRGAQPVAAMGADRGGEFADQAGTIVADDGEDEMLGHVIPFDKCTLWIRLMACRTS